MKPRTAVFPAFIIAAAALSGCTQLAEGRSAGGSGAFPSLYTVPDRPPPGPSPSEAQAMIAELQKTQTSPEAAIPNQPPRPPERQASVTRPVAPAEQPAAQALRTWVATVIPAADGGLSADDRARLVNLAAARRSEPARLILEAGGLSGEAPAVAAIRAALAESGWPAGRIRTFTVAIPTGSGPKVDIFIEY